MKSSGICITNSDGFRNSMLNDFYSEAKNNFDTGAFHFCSIASTFEKRNYNYKIVKLDQSWKKLLLWFLLKFNETVHFKLVLHNNCSIKGLFYSEKANAKIFTPLSIQKKMVSAFDIRKPTETNSNRIAIIAS
jgi:hypothetical protein